MNKRTNKSSTNERSQARTNEVKNERTKSRTNGRSQARTNEVKHERTNTRTNELTNERQKARMNAGDKIEIENK